MKLILRSHNNTAEEIQLGHKLGFTTVKGVDVISITANLNGFTPATAVLRRLGYGKDQFQQIAEECRTDGCVKLYAGREPNLIFVPHTRGYTGRNRSIEYYITRIIQICNSKSFKSLHFSHFGFINGEFQKKDIFRILTVILNPLIHTTLNVLYWEIDYRYLRETMNIYYSVRKLYNIGHTSQAEVIYAPEFEYVDHTLYSDGSCWREFRQKLTAED